MAIQKEEHGRNADLRRLGLIMYNLRVGLIPGRREGMPFE